MDDSVKQSLNREIKDNYKRINSCCIAQNNEIEFEQYYNSCHKETLYHVMSVTKSFISLLIGIAIDKGFITDINNKVSEYLPEYNNNMYYQISDITIKQLLSMTSGIYYRFGKNSSEPLLQRMITSSNWVEFIQSLPIEEQGFQYNSFNYHLLSAIITKATGMNAREFANKNVFDYLNIKQINSYNKTQMNYINLESFIGKDRNIWIEDPQGNSMGGAGLSLTTSDLTRLGLLFLNNGFWEGKSVVSQRWIEESTKTHIKITKNTGYGYGWWTDNGGDQSFYYASGRGGQYIFVVPAQKLVVVFTSEGCTNVTLKNDPKILLIKNIIPLMQK